MIEIIVNLILIALHFLNEFFVLITVFFSFVSLIRLEK